MITELEKEIMQQFEAKLLQILRRYTKDAASFDMATSVFNHSLDSLDLAEVFSWVEQQFGISPMEDQDIQFQTWEDLAHWVFTCLKDRSSSL